MMHRVFVASDDTFIQPFLEQRFGCGTPNLFVIFEMFYDLWIPVVKASDFAGAVLLFCETRGRSQFKGIFGAKKLVIADFCLAGFLLFTFVALSVASDLKNSMAS